MLSRILKRNSKKEYTKAYIKNNIELYIIMLPVLVFLFIFSYIPMYGVLIAFQDYLPGMPFLAFDGSVKWVGLKYIKEFMSSIYFTRLFRNTIILSLYNLAFGFWVPIVFALLLNEIKKARYKIVIQTASYLPYFISSVVVAGMVLSFINVDGIVNNIFSHFGLPRQSFNVNPNAFPVIYTITNIWKSFGWNAIIYMSAISSIDPNLYESAQLDGANRLKQMRYITIPLIMPTVAVLLIFQIGGLLSTNTELILLLYNESVYRTADVIGTYVYRVGMLGGKFSYGTAIGLFTSVINFILLSAANIVSKRISDFGLW
ncbi:MAG: sugar ABC transporter permease [Clostridiaceae bacterium]|nr:sugar ABC transporter permease [Clostridiaceae bacterium]